MFRIRRFTYISVVLLVTPVAQPIPSAAGNTLKTDIERSDVVYGPPINVRCDLKRPSCRKWLSLAKKRQVALLFSYSPLDNLKSEFYPFYPNRALLKSPNRLFHCNDRYDIDRLRSWYMVPPYILRTYSPLYIRCYLLSSYGRNARNNFGWFRGGHILAPYNLRRYRHPYIRGNFYPSYRLDAHYNFGRYRDRLKLVPSYYQTHSRKYYPYLKRSSRIKSRMGLRRSNRGLGRANGGFGRSVGGFHR